LDSTGIGSSWGDFDNDGDRDIFVTSTGGIYLNDHSQGGFYTTVGYGVSGTSSARSCSWTDYDGDGQLDLFIARFGFSSFLYRNDGGNNNWLKVRCRGTVSNRSAIGTKVRAKATINGRPVWQLHEISAQTGHAGQNSLDLNFGFGRAQIVDSLIIQWPSGGNDMFLNVAVNQVLNVTESVSTAVDENTDAVPPSFELAQNYPNPFNPSTTIEYALPKPSDVDLIVYNILGKEVQTLVNGEQPAGKHRVQLDRKGLPSGIYFYRIEAGEFVQTKKMLIVR
jgi:hypothetical protein